MRLAHKRKVQMKLQKRVKSVLSATAEKPVQKKIVKKDEAPAKKVAAPSASTTVSLTPKQQQVLDIVLKNPEGINSKNIGLEAGQEAAKAASWATGALKKLLEENIVQKEQLEGNKVQYKAN
ncbi:MarR family transcriptional regulator [Vibrio algarum]|uniref:MarR family transcriptional regulator n=1 Tax=Vibrio algarum TaxID=3020714 RepID=A0ABT4YRT9_9VIBR|nr:MarR family transcriptional regulator [Vibrio sp. KJ40-1]MDB1123764.1 MarR family transcriptional regulator [Vibrio sp. KJ40-1]